METHSIIQILCKGSDYKNYGVFELNQYWSKEFKEAYGAITRVIPNEIYSKVPVSQETIKRICEISPKFKEIEEYLTGEEADKWSKCGDGKIGEIQGGWIHWAIIKGVDAKGYYKDAKTANQYYKELANEINNAIDEGKIEGYKNKRVTNVPRFNFEDIINSIKKCKDTIRMENNFYLLKIVVQNRLSNDLQENEKWKNNPPTKPPNRLFLHKYVYIPKRRRNNHKRRPPQQYPNFPRNKINS